MKTLPESRLLAITALAVACFSAGFSVTASAYASLSRNFAGHEDGKATASHTAGDPRSCARP